MRRFLFRRFLLGQVLATLVTMAIFLVVFATFAVWQKPLESRVAAMAIASAGVYATILILRLLVKSREWDHPLDVAFAAAVCGTVAMMEWWGAVLAIIAVSSWSVVVSVRSLRYLVAGDLQWSWERPYVLLWGQFLATLMLLVGLGTEGILFF